MSSDAADIGRAAEWRHDVANPLASLMQGVQVLRNRLTVGLEENSRIAEAQGTTIEAIQAYAEARSLLEILSDMVESGARLSRAIDRHEPETEGDGEI